MTTTIEKTRVPAARPAPARLVGARFPRTGLVEQSSAGVATVRVHPVGARFPRRPAAEAAERVPVSFDGARGSRRPAGARFLRGR
jgi:hypothetical protein